MLLKEKNSGFRLEEPGVIALFKTVFDRMSKDEHHRDVPVRERVLKRAMAHGSPEDKAKPQKPKQSRAWPAPTRLLMPWVCHIDSLLIPPLGVILVPFGG